MTVRVAKADGTTEAFDPQKLQASLHRAGADQPLADLVEKELARELYDGIPTEEIYRRAFVHLREHKREAAAHYSLKRALLDFGPSGFPFEAYIAELFRAEGYTCEIDQIVKGACVEHEVDVVMKKNNATVYVEAKFHNTAALKSDLKVALYVKARIDDLRVAHAGGKLSGMIVTNTKFTSAAVQYATCEGLQLLSWGYPQKGSLHERIEAAKLYPLTALTTLSRREKTALLTQKKVLCSSLQGNPGLLESIGVRPARIEGILHEVALLCGSLGHTSIGA